jgi:death-on-curing protein
VTNWLWISDRLLYVMHDRQVVDYGGLPGIRDENAILSALAKPQHHANYGSPDLAELSADYLVGLAKNYGFNDGNKRTAWVAARTFLLLNGSMLAQNGLEAVVLVESVASSQMNHEEVARWYRARIQKIVR